MLWSKLIGAEAGSTVTAPSYTVLAGGISSVSSATLSIPYPSGIQAGDLLITLGYMNANAVASTPSGWNASFNDAYSPLFFKVATGSETGNLVVTKNTTTTNAKAQMFAVRASSGTPSIKGFIGTYSGSSSYTPVGFQNNGSDLVIAGFGFSSNYATSVTGSPEPFTNLYSGSGWSSWYSPNCNSSVSFTSTGSVNTRTIVVNVN